ncbi:NACHT domain-containing protein [Streptomyces sp. NBC_01264]|uniref:NACHT domain-containing protein n=1 Tax=Streptomyces sp. NBC_01264 TaxID=2903804 RepID=UPI002251A0B8|nr:ATP-binding protein [Streptomyces sp. NBC_01264]MCX4776103.1 ATP-binding protein [Streptomyces sp. NBC_01264]
MLLAAPGDGKSTLLQRHLSDTARQLSNDGDGGNAVAHPVPGPVPVPVLVRATDLAAAPLLAHALATAATVALGPFGLREALTEEFFRHRPHPDAPWLVMVDGLDEIPDRATRLSLLGRLSREAGRVDSAHRFIITTRPLPGGDGELDVLGGPSGRFTLQPFTPDDLRAYAVRRFSGLSDVDSHIRRFLTGIRGTHLEDLARTPLMAEMLCRLYTADPSQPLPEGRAGVFRSFIELLYEQNADKRVAALQDEAIHTLTNRYQLPTERRAADQGAQRAREHLPELIDHLAHERIGGNRAPAAEILAAHPHAMRPEKVKPPLWHALLADLLTTTGLLVGHANDLDFLHRTLLEYHAARHATRDDRARAELLRRMSPAPRLRDRIRRLGRSAPAVEPLDPLDLDPSYLGFLLDGLLAPGDRIAAGTLRVLDGLVAPAGGAGYQLLRPQILLGTNVPPGTTARWLIAFASGPVLGDHMRVEAAWYLAEVDGHHEEGARVLARLARDPDFEPFERSWAAAVLAGLDGHREEAAGLLTDLAMDQHLDIDTRLISARDLGKLDGHLEEGAWLLQDCATSSDVEKYLRVQAAEFLAELAGQQDLAGRILLSIAEWGDAYAARALAGMEGQHREDGIGLLTAFAADLGTHENERVRSARYLAEVEGCRSRGIGLLVSLAYEGKPGSPRRVIAAEALAEFDEEKAALLLLRPTLRESQTTLAALAADTSADAGKRLDAARELASLDGHRAEGIVLLTSIADDTSVDKWDRMHAAEALGELGAERAPALLTAFATDPTLQTDARVSAARGLAHVEGHRAEGIRLLAAIADDARYEKWIRSSASACLSGLSYARFRR